LHPACESLFAVRDRYRTFFAPQRAHGKEFVPARLTTQRWNPEDSPENRRDSLDTLGRNALQFEVAANPAMSVEENAK